MIYVKAPLNGHANIEIDILRGNTFSRCPLCGREFPVDLTRLPADKDFIIDRSELLCEQCSVDLIRKLAVGKCESE